ncbi:alginate O-acetyltransferase AlgF [Alteromonas flava]|uniref:alginate O-acetyltransferase AlgF n=1 Tax=Alteromonas flava TaxID=2048003 RepID=UPI000C287D9D|nr:alginate O-acetyltransferase AlgF [Alteromonas flava]
MRTLRYTYSILLLNLLMLTNTAVAEDEALYGAAPPPDAVFFRVFNASEQNVEVVHQDKVLATVEPLQATPYGFSAVNAAMLKINNQPLTLTGPINSQWTIIVTAGSNSPLVILESPFDNKRQARIAVYNLTEHSEIALRTIDGKHTIIDKVPALEIATRDVRAIKIPTAVLAEEQVLVQSEPLMLARDGVTSLFITEANGSVNLKVVQAEQ